MDSITKSQSRHGLRPLVLLELNEVNFEFVRRYVEGGQLPSFSRLFETYAVAETTSENEYEHLEPWIQWVTAHTGLPYDRHRTLRLGDIANSDLEQIWEKLEASGVTVGAISPINAANRTCRSPFFVPDPWTKTPVSGGWVLRQLSAALGQAVGENAQQKLSPATLLRLALALSTHFRGSTIGELASHVLNRRAQLWRAPMFLDRFLADVFVCQWRRHRPGFASLFLNAAAHIQHHYMFSSAAYDGPHRNPDWYIARGADPLLDVYSLYDRILSDVLTLPGHPRVMLATGLHQDPHPTEQYYYRLKDHEQFLRRLGLPFMTVQARMSRDFTIYCASAAHAQQSATALGELRAPDGTPLFEVDNRGRDLFVMLTYPREIHPNFLFTQGSRAMWDLANDVAFVALKNGEHNGIGYFSDTGAAPIPVGTRFPLTEVFERVCTAVGVSETGRSSSRLQAA